VKSYTHYLMNLLDSMDVLAHFDPGCNPFACGKMIYVPDPSNLLSFAICMHELGHVATYATEQNPAFWCGPLRADKSAVDEYVMTSEINAWAWAEKRMKQRGWWTDAVEEHMWYALGTYTATRPGW
jgi:hypothetical protein